jgi:acetyl-CoA carboxylase biotin carboxyl carrier protein
MSDHVPVKELVALVDRLEHLLERSGLSELEVEHEGRTVVLRTPAAITPMVAAAARGPAPVAVPEPTQAPEEAAHAGGAHAISAPLTGVFYRSPSPGAEPYVREGGEVSAGQVIGLIEAMKLFNEIKSDVTGTVRRIGASDGDLVKARQTLIEVDPA